MKPNLSKQQIRIYKLIEKTKKIIEQHELMVTAGKSYLHGLEIKHAQVIAEMQRVLEVSK